MRRGRLIDETTGFDGVSDGWEPRVGDRVVVTIPADCAYCFHRRHHWVRTSGLTGFINVVGRGPDEPGAFGHRYHVVFDEPVLRGGVIWGAGVARRELAREGDGATPGGPRVPARRLVVEEV